MEDVVITGLGVVTNVGKGIDQFWSGLTSATSSPLRVPDPDARMPLPLMYLVPRDGTDAEQYTANAYATSVADEALADAGLHSRDLRALGSRAGLVFGTGMDGSGRHESWRTRGYPAGADWAPTFESASAVAGRLGIGGPVTSVSNACAASGFALSMAADLIRSGEADLVLAGGAEAYSRVALGCFNRLGAIDAERCRPFDRQRGGTVFGEGAAFLVLEAAGHAARRSARGYARLAGEGWSCDAHHQTAPEPTGAQITRAMRAALEAAGIAPQRLGCVVPHGTGTALNDRVESEVLNEILGGTAQDVPIYSLKGLIGHTGGAAGALAVLVAALMLHRGVVPPNVPLADQDPECKLRISPETAALDDRYVLVNAYAFGGNNVSLILEGMDPR